MFKISYNYDARIAVRKTFVAQCARVKDFCCVVDAIPQRSSFVVVLPYKNFCWLQSANVR